LNYILNTYTIKTKIMANDPAFLFYPGDYLRDTQCLCEKSQVAYDRIMCEHMRNICISQEQLNFFTKKLNAEENAEVLMVLTKIEGGYQIKWVAESISKRRSYSESRRQNRSSKSNNISKSYDLHMDNENEIVNEDDNKDKKEKSNRFAFRANLVQYGFDKQLVDDWMLVRKTKRSTNSKTAFDGFISEIEKRSCVLDEVMAIMVEKSWAGFKWEWIDNLKGNGTKETKRDTGADLNFLIEKKYGTGNA
jgi:hypothetical protein